MQTILVPTDFSETAANAAHYAIHLAKQINCSRIILYHAYQAPFTTDAVTPSLEIGGLDEIKEAGNEGIEKFRKSMIAYAGSESSIEFDVINEYAFIAENIEDVCKANSVDLVVMGITGGDKMEEILIGSNTISIAKNTTVPVIIVPAKAKFTPIEQIVFACDFKKIVETTPVQPIKKLLDETKAKLFVLHVNHIVSSADKVKEMQQLDALLKDYNPEYHFVENEDFTEGINEFVTDKKIDIIITIPKKHGLFESLFKRSHVKMMAFHSHVPLVVIHE